MFMALGSIFDFIMIESFELDSELESCEDSSCDDFCVSKEVWSEIVLAEKGRVVIRVIERVGVHENCSGETSYSSLKRRAG